MLRFDVSNDGVVPRRLMVGLVTDCVVCIGLVDAEVLVSFWFIRRVFFEPVLSAKAEIPTGTRHDFGVFLNRHAPCCINPPTVLEFVTSSSRYDDAPIHATRGHPIARRLERRRRGSAGEVVPGLTSARRPVRLHLVRCSASFRNSPDS